MFATNNFGPFWAATSRLSFFSRVIVAGVAAIAVFLPTTISRGTISPEPALASTLATEVASGPVPTWKFTGITVKTDWVNAEVRSRNVDVNGGQVDLSIRGTRWWYCAPTGSELLRFRWHFERDISVLRLGEDFGMTQHVQLITTGNPCTGQLEGASGLEPVTSNNARYSKEESGLFEDRIVCKKCFSALGGNRTPPLRDVSSVMTVHPNPAITKDRMRFEMNIGGPCDDPEPYKCGYLRFQYNYELVTTGGGGGGGGGGSGNACGYTIGSGIYDKWMQMGGQGGVLGCARSGESEAGRSPFGTTGRYALFSGWANAGVIIWHANGRFAGRSFEVHGAIGQLYQSLGGTNSYLGFPVSDEYSVPGGRRSDFEGGYIIWDASTGRAQAFRYPTADYDQDRGPGGTFTRADNVTIGDSPIIRFFALQSASADLCEQSCKGTGNCVAYTFVRPGAYGAGDPPMCYLFSAVKQRIQSACCITGIKK